jgi:hypothetical protein
MEPKQKSMLRDSVLEDVYMRVVNLNNEKTAKRQFKDQALAWY